MGLEVGFFSLPVNDFAMAKRFYNSVMDWEFEQRDERFCYINSGDNMIGALELPDDSFRPSNHGPKLYFRANTMNLTLSKVVPMGGIVSIDCTPIDGGERGYTAEVSDPFGNRIAFWAPEQ